MFKSRHIVLTLLSLVLAAPLCQAQATAAQPLDNAAVVQLVASGVSEEQILQTIATSAGHYDTGGDAEAVLKKGGVTDKEVDAMRKKNADTYAAAVAAATAIGGTVIPPGVDGEGVYYKDPKADTWVEFKPETAQYIRSCGIKTACGKASLAKLPLIFVPLVVAGPVLAVASIPISVARIKDFDHNGYIPGKTAELAFNRPVEILIYTPEDRSPKDYHLVKLRLDPNLPEVRIFDRGNAFNGRGLSKRDLQTFKATKLGFRFYRVTLGPEYQPGEYGLFLPDAAVPDAPPNTSNIFTFRIIE
jgi:hypothetical protein